MTATPGFKGFGSKVSWNGTPIGYCRDIPFPSITRDKVDLSNSQSDDEFEESESGMGHPGEVTFEVIFVPGESGQSAAIEDLLSGTTREMIIIGPTAAAFTWTCNAWVSAINGQMPYSGSNEIIMNLTLTLTGKPTLGVTYAPNMSALSLTTADLYPDFAAATYDYTATTTGTSVTVTPTCATADSIEVWAEVSGVMTLISTLSSGQTSSAISAGSAGDNTEIEVKVKKSGYATRVTKVRLIKTA
jgi:hypothetical protein